MQNSRQRVFAPKHDPYERIVFVLPRSLIAGVDEVRDMRGYPSRMEAARALLREAIKREKRKAGKHERISGQAAD